MVYTRIHFTMLLVISVIFFPQNWKCFFFWNIFLLFSIEVFDLVFDDRSRRICLQHNWIVNFFRRPFFFRRNVLGTLTLSIFPMESVTESEMPLWINGMSAITRETAWCSSTHEFETHTHTKIERNKCYVHCTLCIPAAWTAL